MSHLKCHLYISFSKSILKCHVSIKYNGCSSKCGKFKKNVIFEMLSLSIIFNCHIFN